MARSTPAAIPESLAELLARLTTSPAGLSAADARRRLDDQGPNQLAVKSTRAKVVEVVRSALNPLVVILLLACVVSGFLGQVADASIIGGIVVLSTAINVWQTFHSERAVKRLQAQIAPTATVRRDGRSLEVPRCDLVVGDIVLLSAGDLVPADARLVEATDLYVQQAGLSGESMPAEKSARSQACTSTGPDALELVFLGTSIVSGHATAVVVATGRATAFGDIAARLAARPAETEFDRGMHRYGMLIVKTVIVLVIGLLVINLALGRGALSSLLFSVAVAVGLTPEFLPMITTVTLAQGAVRLARDKVIVKHLSAIQNLGSIDVLCSDKTGTLTAGTMSLDASLDPRGQPGERALFLGHLNSAFESGIKSPLDVAILQRVVSGCDGYTKIDEIPFDFERRRLSVVVATGTSAYLLVTKGAPESVLAACSTYETNGGSQPLDAAATEASLAVFRGLSSCGFRVLAVASRTVPHAASFHATDERELTFAGFLTFADHLLDGVGASIEALRADGVEVKIVTGDNELVTGFICDTFGFGRGRIVLGDEIARLDDAALVAVADQTNVFARVSPAQKQRIIMALKAGGHVVGFLGDGINDAPSLHAADVGISVAGAVDVAREASDIILMDSRLDAIHAGIVAGRRSFTNVLKYLLMGTSSNFGNMFSMVGAALFLPFLPMLPTQILLNNFLYDFAQITIPTDRVDADRIRRPQRWDLKLIKRFMIIMGPLSSLYDFLTFFVMLRWFQFGAVAFHTGWFVESLATQTLVLFVIRTKGRPWTHRPSVPLIITTLLVVVVGCVLPYTPVADALGLAPLPPGYLAFVAVAVASYMVLVETVKHRVMRRLDDDDTRMADKAYANTAAHVTT